MKKLEIKDLLKYKSPDNIRYNQDGSILAFNVIRSDEKKNNYRSDVYICKDGKCTQVTWTLDASFVDFDDNETLILRRKDPDNNSGKAELYKLVLGEGEAKPWIELPLALGSIKKVKENLYVLSARIDAENPDDYLLDDKAREEKKKEKEKDKDYHIVDEVPYWFNGAGFTNKVRNALFILDLSKGVNLKRITKPFFDAGDFIIKDEKVYYTGAEWNGRLKLVSRPYVYDLKTKKTQVLYKKEEYGFGELFFIGKELYCFVNDMKTYGINQTSDVYKLKDGKLELVYKPEISLYCSMVGDTNNGHGRGSHCDGKSYITIGTKEDHNVIYSYNASFKKKVIFDKPGMINSLAVSKDKIAFVYQDDSSLSEVYEINKDGNDFKRLSHINDGILDGYYVAKPEVIEYKSEGYDLKGWVLLPKDYNPKKKYPAVLDVHGGPRCVYGEVFFHEMQVWANEGYFVFFTNIKGSDGRGDDFADIRDDYGGTDFRNLMDFTDAVLARYPNIDKKRLCETGGSYGGFMTNWIISHTDRFACAASQRSISNWVSMSFISDIGLYFGDDQCGAKNPFDTEKLWEHSPLKYAENVKTPTLFIHSDEDYRCPLPEGMQMMQAIRYNGMETRMVIFKGENHELSRSGKPLHRIKRLEEITGWFNKYCK